MWSGLCRTLIILVLLVSPCWAAPAKVQSTSKNTAAGSSDTLAYTSNVTAGSLLIVAVKTGTTAAPTSVADSLGQTFTKDVEFRNDGNNDGLTLWSFANSASGANTVTVTLPGSTSIRWAILEYSGMATSNVFTGSVVQQTATGTTVDAGGVRTIVGDSLVIDVMCNSAAQTITADGSFTAQETVPANPNARFQVSHRIVSSVGFYDSAVTNGASAFLTLISAAYKGATGSVQGCYLMENNTDYYLMEDNSSFYALEGGDGGLCAAAGAATWPGWYGGGWN